MGINLVVIDAFSSAAFHGNPAAIAVVDAFPEDEVMQSIAMEMNLSETAFTVPRSDGDYDLRWFTPTVEIDLCGHATLAAAHVIGSDVRFHTRSGVLACAIGKDGWIAMDFPADIPVASEKPEWLAIDGISWFGRCGMGVLVELTNQRLVENFVPDFAALSKLSDATVIITARSNDDGIDFVSRVFGPSIGIAEDPVTGSSHCVLAEYWGEQLRRQVLTGAQLSARGGFVKMIRQGDRVELQGQAVVVSRVQFVN